MTKKWITGAAVALCSLLVSTCSQPQQSLQFDGIYMDDPQGTCGLYNPGRGFRLETAVDVKYDTIQPEKQLAALSEKYAADSVSLSQSYLYLTYLAGKPLSETNFHTMQRYFDELQRLGKKAVLRFAYEKDFMGRAPVGPTKEQIITHLEQLKPFLEKNKDLILVVQAGLVGAWGEWHSSVHGLENSKETLRDILKKLLEVVPEEKQVQVRIPAYKNLLKEEATLYKRVSFHDDFIVIRPDRWDGEMHEGTVHFNQMVQESPYLIVDGELPWGFWSVGADPDSPSAGWIIDGMQTARRLFLQHFTSLSVIHNYKEQHPNRTFDENNPPEYSMRVWKKTMITENSLNQYHMPVSENYFRKKDGSAVQRSVFDYIRDHLGYRIELQSLQLPRKLEKGKKNLLRLELINRGFSTVHGEYQICFVLIDKEGHITEFPTIASPKTWQPYQPEDTTCTPLIHTVELALNVPDSLSKGNYRLGLWIPDNSHRLKYDSHYAIRCANRNINWQVLQNGKLGVNVLTDIEIK